MLMWVLDLKQGLANFFSKGSHIKYLCFVGHMWLQIVLFNRLYFLEPFYFFQLEQF